MCGLSGAVGIAANIAGRIGPLNHRGPDSHDSYSAPGVLLRHYRLAIIGNESVAHQPMWSHDRKIVFVYNGEIYNYKELAEAIGQPELAEAGDSRVLLEILARHGQHGLEMLNGMFSFAAWFQDRGEMLLVRDRFGVKPLYWTKIGTGIAFASEIKALLPLSKSQLDQTRIDEYLEAGVYPSGKNCFYDNIFQLEAGTWLKWRSGNIETGRWFDLEREVLQKINTVQTLNSEMVEELLADSIRLRLRSDVPISLHFSGGIDSTAILLKAREMWQGNIPLVAYTSGFDGTETDESKLAASYCRSIGAENRRVVLTADEVPQLAQELQYFVDEPFGGVPTLAYYKLNKVERQDGFIVSLEGQGGDESFAGYLTHAAAAALDNSENGIACSNVERVLGRHGISKNDAVEMARRIFSFGLRSHTDLTDLRKGGDVPKKFIDWLRTAQLHDCLVNKIPRVLRFNDRASMACGREVRFPLLDWRMVVLGLALPHEQKFAGGVPKAPLQHIIRRHLPVAYAQQKRSVVTPQTEWLRGPLKDWALAQIAALRRSGLVASRHFVGVEKFYAEDAPRNSFKIWQLINLSLMLEHEQRKINQSKSSNEI